MQTAVKRYPFDSRKDFYNIYFMGDWHLGAKLCDETLLEKDIERVRKDKRAIVFLMGDLGDFISTRDKRFDAGQIAEWIAPDDIVGSQIQRIDGLLKPIADKVVGVLDGNHEHSIKRDFSLRVKRQLIERAYERGGAWRDLSYSSLVRLAFDWKRKGGVQRDGITLYLHHGFGGGKTMSEAAHYLPYFAAFECDWIVFGHTHKRYAGDAVRHRINNRGELIEKRLLWGRSGTYLRSIVKDPNGGYGYAEMAGFLPTWRGCLSVRYYPQTQEWSWLGE